MCTITDRLSELIADFDIDPISTTSMSFFKEVENTIIDYKLQRKEILSESLLDIKDASMRLYRVEAGGSFPENKHKPPALYELLIVLDGVLEVHLNNKDNKILQKLDTFRIDRDVTHSVKAIKDSLFIAIIVPNENKRFSR